MSENGYFHLDRVDGSVEPVERDEFLKLLERADIFEPEDYVPTKTEDATPESE